LASSARPTPVEKIRRIAASRTSSNVFVRSAVAMSLATASRRRIGTGCSGTFGDFILAIAAATQLGTESQL
jgi:hypothetical protein